MKATLQMTMPNDFNIFREIEIQTEVYLCVLEIAKAAKIAREAGLMNDPVQQKQEPMPRIIHPQTKEELRKFWKVTADW